ncbi:MAG TPA: CapA family protein [Saprospiraceae bacterium]|nr:CapA family protein [Saprospiraceae bacterium]HRK80644.1 CapA family protein [Saprospiraceae bacterium]
MPICSNSRKPSLNALWLFIAVAFPLFLQAQSDNVRRLKLIFAGDIMGHETQIRAAEVEKDKLYDYTPCFEYVAPILKQADLAIGNLELTLPGKPPYTGYPMFKSPEELALALRHAGFDLLVTSNNHSNDGGLNGVINTLNTLDNYNFYHTGTFRDSLERNDFYPLIVYKNDFRLAFLNYTYGTNGLITKPPSVVNLIDEQLIAADMETARQMAPDFIIVIMHWGDEYQIIENKTQRDLAAKLIGWGADLVIGAHPHVVQPVRQETAAGADSTGRKVWTAYSLGNYISGQRKINTDGGMMLEVELQKTLPAGPTALTDIAFIPTWVWIQTLPTGKRHYRILPVAAFEQENNALPKLSETDRALLKRHGAALRKHLPAIRERVIRAEDLLSE